MTYEEAFDQLYKKYEKRLTDATQKVIDAIKSDCKLEEQVRTEVRNIYYDFVSDLKSCELGLEIKE